MDWIRSLYSDVTVTGWDPGTDQYHTPPRQQFDGIYSIDVWEHIELQAIPDAVENLRTMSHDRTTWCHIIDLTPAKKLLPDGRNAHVTLLNTTQWQDQFEQQGCVIEQLSMIRLPDPNFGVRERCQILCRP